MCRLCYRVFKTTIGFKANPLGFSTVREDTEPSAGLFGRQMSSLLSCV